MRWTLLISLLTIIISCSPKKKPLPVLGKHDYVSRKEGAKEVTDTVFYKVPDFSFLGHRSVQIDKKTIEGKVTIVDFSLLPVLQFARNVKKYEENFTRVFR